MYVKLHSIPRSQKEAGQSVTSKLSCEQSLAAQMEI